MYEDESRAPKLIVTLIVVTIILVLSLAGLGFWSWYNISQANKQLSEANSRVSELQAEKTKSETDEASEDAGASSGEYYVIKEWGVKFKPGKDLSDLYYYVRKDHTGKDSELHLATKSMLVATDEVNAQLGFGAIGTVVRGKKGQEFNNTTFDKIPNAIQVGDYYYSTVGPQSTFGDPEDKKYDSVNDLQEKQATALKEAIKTLQAAE